MKHWRKIKKQQKLEQKWIRRYLKLCHIPVTNPVKWDQIHVVKKAPHIKHIKDIKSVSLVYEPTAYKDQPALDVDEIMRRLVINTAKANIDEGVARLASELTANMTTDQMLSALYNKENPFKALMEGKDTNG